MSDRFIAIRRPDTSGAPRVPDSEERARRVRTAFEEAGRVMGERMTAVATLAEVPPEQDRGGYVELPRTESLILEPPAGVSLDRVGEVLGDEYIVMPDLELTQPAAETVKRVPAPEVRPVTEELPDVTGVQRAHAEGNRGKGAVVVVFDTGCDADHAEFDGRTVDFAFVPMAGTKLRTVRGFDTATHGTHVSGRVGGQVVGIAPEADLIVVSVIESERFSTSASRVHQALEWLTERLAEPRYSGKPVILNMSLGFKPEDIEAQAMGSTMEAIRVMLAQRLADGVLPVIAIGNDGEGIVRAPAYYPESLSVGAVDYGGVPWPSSGSGAGPAGYELEMNPDLAGFGVGVVSSTERDAEGASWYGEKKGTSMAAPYVAGIAALVAAKTGLQGTALRDRLLETVKPLDGPAGRTGRGLARYDV